MVGRGGASPARESLMSKDEADGVPSVGPLANAGSSAREAGLPGVTPFDTRAELLTWLSANGLAHVARLSFEAIAPFVAPAFREALKTFGAKKRLIELASVDQLERSRQWLAASEARVALEQGVLRFIDAERESVQRARALVAQRVLPLEDPAAKQVFEVLLGLRAAVAASVAPKETLASVTAQLDLPGFVVRDLLPSERRPSGGFQRAETTIILSPPKVQCSCGFDACVHVLAAIDSALVWCRQPTSSSHTKTLEQLLRPAWQRTLESLEHVFEADASTEGFAVCWGIRVVDSIGVEAVAMTRRGPAKWVELPKAQLFRMHGTTLSPLDAKLASLLPGADEEGSFVSRVFLEGLLGHPRVVLRDSPERSARVERAVVGLVAEERLGSLSVRPGVDGATLPEGLRERVRTAGAHEALFFWDEGPRKLTLLEVKPELRSVLNVLHQQRGAFPPESHSALLASLSKWAHYVPVSMPRSVMGESVPAMRALVLRLQTEETGGVVVEIRVRPLPDGPALVPGAGARDVHLRRAEKAVHALRDLRAETRDAEAFCERLPLSSVELLPLPFQFRFEAPVKALELLEAATHFAPPVELEWVGKPIRSVGAHGPSALKVVLERRREWFGVLGELNAAGERVELARLIDAVRRKDRYLQVSTHTYLELTEALRLHLEHLGDHVHPTRHGLEVGPAAVGVLQALESAGATVDADAAWRALEARIIAAKALPLEVPAGLQVELRSYQIDGFRWLATLAAWGAGGVLADDMGLGKTVQALALLLHRNMLGPALVVAPTSVAFNWQEEAARFAPSLKLIIYADESNRVHALSKLGPGDVLVVSYGLLVRDLERLAAVSFATAVFDEAQGLKNSKTQRFRAARQLDAGFKCALSGTPLENHLGELWSLYAVIFPLLFGSWETFRGRFAVPIEKHIDPAAAPALSRLLAPFLLRRTKGQVESELPPRIEVRVPVILSTAEWQMYEDARLAALSDLETPKSKMREQERRVEVLAALTRLRLIASHPKLHDERSTLASSKLARLLELVEELRAEGHRTLIFSQFTSHLALVREALDARGLASVYLDGQTPRQARADRVHEFQEGDAPLFLISLKAGGFGLNLTAASTVIHLDPWWNPAVEDQASDRAHRLGQTKPVTIFRLVAMGTIEEEMLSLHAAKRSLVAQVLDGTSQASRLSTQALIDLIARGSVEHKRAEADQ